MISVRTILTISSYEGKVLWRNWFFRIIALAGILFVTIFNIAIFSELGDAQWKGLANGWVLPYASLLLISIPQAAAVVFLATGLIKKDKKLDTNEVFFVRPITNVDYVFGKALALVKLFFLLNLLLLIIPLVVGFTSPVATINPLAFLLYPWITTIPSIVFTTGISFLLVTMIRNQPISIVLLIGLAGVQLIYYFDKFSNILDFTSFRLPMLASEISGFVDLEFALWQRAFYFLAGIAFLFITAYLLDRLASRQRTHRLTLMTGGVLVVFSVLIMAKLWNMRYNTLDARADMIAINGKWATVPNATVTKHTLSVIWSGDQIICTSEMELVNKSTDKLDTVFFTLNPGLKVREVYIDGKAVDFKRDKQIIYVRNGVNINGGQRIKVKMTYNGWIDQSIAHLEVDQERYEMANEHLMFSLFKKYAFLEDDYLLLTKDVYWYPETELGYNQKFAARPQQSFIEFTLHVEAPEGKTPISQGDLTILNGVYHFKPAYSLPHLSLVVGNYQKKEITIDSVVYSVFHYPENEFLFQQLNQLSDTVSYLITDIVNEYEDAQNLSYPFKKLQFVEVPVHFTAYNKIYESHQAFLQPETVFWPEEGGEMNQFDLRQRLKDMNNQAAKTNQVLTEKQKQANVFNDLIRKIFTKQTGSTWVYEGKQIDNADYSLFANYYNFNSGIVSDKWPLLNRSIANYLRKDKVVQKDYSREIHGISFTEQCNELMRTSPLNKILTESPFGEISKSVALKSQYLFAYLGHSIGEAAFKSFLFDWVKNHQHQISDYNEFRLALVKRFNIDIDPLIQKVYAETSQPAFEILDVKNYEVMDGERKRYQVLVTTKNSGDGDGVIELKFNEKKKTDDDEEEEVADETPGRLSVIRQGETKLLGFVLDEKPNDLAINTVISRNVPSIINIPLGTQSKNEHGPFFDGDKPIDYEKSALQYEVVIDNEDAEFTHFSPIEPTILKAYLEERNAKNQKYYGEWASSYSKWQATTGSDYYGRVVRSAHFTKAGTGKKIATWTPKFKEEGFYDIYVYLKGKNQNEYTGNSGDGQQYEYHYIIRNGDGIDNIKYNISDAEPGWNYIGSYYFNTTGGSVSLTDECELRTVYADAVKFVKQ